MVAFPKIYTFMLFFGPSHFCWKKTAIFDTQKPDSKPTCFFLLAIESWVEGEWFPWSIFSGSTWQAKSSNFEALTLNDLDANHTFTNSLFGTAAWKKLTKRGNLHCNTDLHRRWRCRALSKVQCVQANIHFSQMRISALPGIRKKKYMPTSWWSFKPSVWTIMPSPIDHVQKVQRNPRVWSGKSYPCRIDASGNFPKSGASKSWKLPKSSDRTRFSAKTFDELLTVRSVPFIWG